MKRRRHHVWPWLLAGAFLLSSAGAFGGSFFPLVVALVFAWLLAHNDHHHGANTPAIRRAKRKIRP